MTTIFVENIQIYYAEAEVTYAALNTDNVPLASF